MRMSFSRIVTSLMLLAFATSLSPREVTGVEPTPIGVSGHWVVEIQDPDGSLVTRREFHNAVLLANIIPDILGRVSSPGSFLVSVGCNPTTSCHSPCNGSCQITESRVVPATAASKTLVVSVLPDGSVRLRGQAVAQFDGTIERFGTSVRLCANTLSPIDCAKTLGSVYGITDTDQPPITVVKGQAIVVTVNLAFVPVSASATP